MLIYQWPTVDEMLDFTFLANIISTTEKLSNPE